MEEVFITDINFRNYIISALGKTKDYVITINDCLQISYINCSNHNIVSLEGIQFFENLEDLVCDDNFITDLDLSKNINLCYLSCMRNCLTTLNLQYNISLNHLYCKGNLLERLIINSDLFHLAFNSCKLNEIDLRNTKIKEVSCLNNEVKVLKNVSGISKIDDFKSIFKNLNMFDKLTIII